MADKAVLPIPNLSASIEDLVLESATSWRWILHHQEGGQVQSHVRWILPACGLLAAGVQVLPDVPVQEDLVKNLYDCHYSKFFVTLGK